MKLTIVSRDFSLTDSIRFHIEEKISRLLAWNWKQIHQIRITVGDLNGPRGGVDKYCHVTVDLETGHTIRIEQAAVDLYDAINTAVTRTERNVLGIISRERQRERRLGLGRIWG